MNDLFHAAWPNNPPQKETFEAFRDGDDLYGVYVFPSKFPSSPWILGTSDFASSLVFAALISVGVLLAGCFDKRWKVVTARRKAGRFTRWKVVGVQFCESREAAEAQAESVLANWRPLGGPA